MEGCTFRFLNWEKFQGDAKRYESTSWFRIENTMWMHPLWDALEDKEFRALLFLLSYVSQRAHKTGEVELNFKTLQRMSGVTPAAFVSTVRKLRDLGMAELTESTITSTHSDCTVQAPGENCATKITKITNNNAQSANAARASAFDFDSIYREYPRKKGKTRGRKVFVREIKTPEDFDALQNAVLIARDYYRQNKTDPKFIPYFSTFMGSWRDCLDPDWGQTDVAQRVIRI